MNKKLQVFVSSTYTDLIEERQAAVEAILDAGHIPAGMELFKAGNESQLKTIYRWIDESDVYMLILGGRYGSIEKESGKSYTQLEYEYALSKNIPIFAVVLSQSFLTDKINSLGLTNILEQIAPDKYQSFKSLVMSKIIREVDECKDIKIAIFSTLNEFMNEYDLIGWTRNITNKNIHCYSHGDSSLPVNIQTVINKFLITSHSKTQPMSAFVVMSYTEKWSHDVYSTIKESCANSGINVTISSEILGSDIIDNIISLIKNSDIIIVDVSVNNANVFYELGFASALGKNIILICQSTYNIPFDIKHFRILTYKFDSTDNIKKFKDNLTYIINLYKDKQ